MFDRLRNYRQNRRLARELQEVRRQLARIADVLERRFPAAAHATERVDVEEVDLGLQRLAEMADAYYLQQFGRLPSPDETMQWVEERKHLH